VVHSGSWALAQTARSTSGGWDLDASPAWYAAVSSSKSYTASIWVYSTAKVTVVLNVNLLSATGDYVDSANGPNVTLTPNTWTKLTATGIKAASGELYAGMEPNLENATKGTVMTWDDMSLTTA